jgi:hypothetical protein
MTRSRAVRLSRRAFLAGAAGAAGSVLLAACGTGDDDDSGGTVSTTAPPARRSLVKFFGDDVLASTIPQRATFGLTDEEGVVSSDVPPSLDFRLLRDGEEVAVAPSVTPRSDGLPRPYFPLAFTVDAPGVYTAITEVDGAPLESSFQVLTPAEVRLPQVGEPMRPFDTPTVGDQRGVNPICTAEPQCPLHDVTLTEALGEGRPVAFIVSTPRFCQVAICGPVLDVLLSQQEAFPNVRMVHAEVYTDETTETLAPAIGAYGLTFEPALFLAGSDGRLATRFDNIWDTTELAEALGSVT